MTRGGSFKRAVRREARAAGVSYTQALARTQRDRDTVDRRVRAWRRWHRLDGLGDHFWRTYRVRVAAVTTLSAHGGGIFRVDLADRPTPWVARVVPPDARAADRLHEDVEILRLLERVGFPAERCHAADACDGLPEALTTPRTGGPNVLVTDDGTGVFVDWKSGGRGPRLAAVAGLLQAAARHPRADYVVDAVIDGYTQHVRLSPEELDRLAGAMRLRPAYYAAWGYWQAVGAGRPPVGSERWWPDRRATEAIAERVVGRLTDGEPER